MKFILPENKFILNETYKFILDERLILKEADDTSSEAEIMTTIKWLTVLLNNIGEGAAIPQKIKAYLDACEDTKPLAAPNVKDPKDNDKWKSLELEAQKLEPMTRAPLDSLHPDNQKDELKEIGKQLKAYLTALSNVITENQKQIKKNLDKAVKTLTDLQTKLDESKVDSLSEKEIPKLLQQIKQLPEGLTQIKTALQKYLDVSTQKIASTKIVAFKNKCKDIVTFLGDKNTKDKFKLTSVKAGEDAKEITTTKLKNFPESALKEFQTAVSEALNSVKELEPYEDKNAEKILANIEGYSKKIEAIKLKFEAIRECDVYKDSPKTEEDDWQAKFLAAPASAKPKVVEEFIYKTWPDDAIKVLEIGEEVMAACKAFGFATEEANANPLLYFINNIYLKYGFTKEKYRAVHNAMADSLLKKEDLLGNGVLGKGNLVFCKALYALDPAVITGYLKKQASLLKARTKPDKFGTIADMAFSAIYKIDVSGDSIKGVVSSSQDLTLRSLDEISRYEAEWTGASSDVSEEAVADDALVAKIADAGVDTAVKVIVAIAFKFSSEPKIIEAAKKCTEVKELLDKAISPSKMIELLASTGKYIPKATTAEQALKVVTGLINSDKLGLTKE